MKKIFLCTKAYNAKHTLGLLSFKFYPLKDTKNIILKQLEIYNTMYTNIDSRNTQLRISLNLTQLTMKIHSVFICTLRIKISLFSSFIIPIPSPCIIIIIIVFRSCHSILGIFLSLLYQYTCSKETCRYQ